MPTKGAPHPMGGPLFGSPPSVKQNRRRGLPAMTAVAALANAVTVHNAAVEEAAKIAAEFRFGLDGDGELIAEEIRAKLLRAP